MDADSVKAVFEAYDRLKVLERYNHRAEGNQETLIPLWEAQRELVEAWGRAVRAAVVGE